MGTPIAAMLSKNLQLFIVPLESSTMLSDNDGVCNSMPGWNPLSIWNPRDYHEDPDCRLNPMYQQRGMGVGASYGGQYAIIWLRINSLSQVPFDAACAWRCGVSGTARGS